jgi:hypothetical protein
MPYNMQEHYLLFSVAVDVVFEKRPLPKEVTKLEKRSPFHPKKFNTTNIITMIDEPEIVHPFPIPGGHRTITDPSPEPRYLPKPNKHPGTDDSNQRCSSNHKLTTLNCRIHTTKQDMGAQISMLAGA